MEHTDYTEDKENESEELLFSFPVYTLLLDHGMTTGPYFPD
jgi:hypothetical protein